MTRTGALALAGALVGCRPVLYELVDGATGGLTEQGSETMSTETGSGDTEAPTATDGPPPPTCHDGGQSGEESDVDCGGPQCPPCGPGSRCATPEDCASGLCEAGTCAPPFQCAEATDCPPEPCRAASCTPDTRQCVYADLDGAGCDDGDLCTGDDVCKAGKCAGTPTDCGALGGACQVGFCNPQTGNCAYEPLADGQPCDDGLMCTFESTCAQGVCAGKPPPPLLFDEFVQPFGWNFDDPWAIGPAAPSACADNGFEDPPEDHSPGPDNFLAGAAIGGCLPDAPLDACLTSPPIDAMVPGSVWLTFWSRLSATPVPGGARVDVFDGNSWQPIFDTKGEPFDEPEWTYHALDVSPYKSFALQVRFCHHVPFPGLPIASGWSVDDVYVGAPGCEP